MLDPDRAHRLAELALRLSKADETEVAVRGLQQALHRFTGDHPVQNVLRQQASLSVRVRVDGREGKATTGTITEDAVAAAVARAADVARRMPRPSEELVPLPAPGEQDLRSAVPDSSRPDEVAEQVASMVEVCRASDCRASGIHDTATTLCLVMNSAGLDVHEFDQRTEVSLSAFKEDGAGWGGRIVPPGHRIDGLSVARQAVGKALASRGAGPLEPGHYTVVLEPSAVASLLLFTAYCGFGAQQVEDGSSFLSGRMGEPVLGSNVSILDDAHHPLAVGHTFDGEGCPRQRVTLIENGVARNAVHDHTTARRAGCVSTGHALPQPSADGPMPANLLLVGGEGDSNALVRDVDQGILVTDLHYTNMVEPTRLTLTGMTRYGTFLIEKGQITRPVRNLRFTQSLVEALNRVTTLGASDTLCTALFGGNTVAPPLRIDGFRFSSTTEF